jgi:hypothetical protein
VGDDVPVEPEVSYNLTSKLKTVSSLFGDKLAAYKGSSSSLVPV